jgi:hypothetical protein
MFRKNKTDHVCEWQAIAYVKTDINLALDKAIQRVRELHKLRIEVNQNGFANDTCDGCYDEDPSTGEQFHHDYPCPTIKALDGITYEA